MTEIAVNKLTDENKFELFISIHKPPASNRFAPMEHALAVTVEPFKFSPP